MDGLKRLAKPGWVIGLVAVVAFAYACFTVLAPWQLGKSDQLDARNTKLTESVRADPVPLDELVTAPSIFSDQEWRKVTVTGSWVPNAEILLRMRSVDSSPVYQALTVFRPEAGPEILVNRGWVLVGENNSVPTFAPAPAGTVSITARLRAGEPGRAEPMNLYERRMVRQISLPDLAADLGRPITTSGYLQLGPEQPGSLNPAPIPDVENGPYLSYGLQWLSFGILAPLALGYFAWSEFRRRRNDEALTEVRTRTKDASGADTAEDMPSSSALDVRSAAEPVATGASLARYGDRFEAERRRALRRGDRLG